MSNNASIKKRLLMIAAAASLLVTAVLSGCSPSDDKNTSGSSTPASSVTSDTQKIPADAIAAKSDNFNLRKPIVSFIFNNTYMNRRDYASFQGLDVTKSLKEQYYSEEQGITWFDVFMDETKRYVQQILVMCEAADEKGLALEQSDLDSIEQTIQNIRTAAQSVSMTFEDYIVSVFGEGVTEEMIREYARMTTLANKFYLNTYDSYTYTQEDYEKYFEENKTSYQYADFLQYNFSFAADGEASVDEKTQKAAKEKAKAYADNLAQCRTAEEFKKYIEDYLTKNPSLISSAAGQTLTGSELKAAVEADLNKLSYEKYAYEVTSNAGKWIFDESRKALDTTVIENANSYTVLMVTKAAYRDETVSKNVRHILFTPSSYQSDTAATDDAANAAAMQKANEVYESWKTGDKTEASFAELAKQFSDDTGSKDNGGLYEDVTEGQMVSEFNDWLFDGNRKPGDSGIVKTNYGYHIMYFVGDGEPTWQLSVDTVMRKTDFEETYEALAQKYTVEFIEEVLNAIQEAETPETSAITYDESSEEESAAQESAAQESTAQESAAQESAAQESAAQESAAQESAAQESAASATA